MPEVQISGQTVTIERFRLDKAMRVITLLQLMQKQAPEVTKVWAEFRKDYAENYSREIDRINALAIYGPSLDHVTEADWERAGQKFRVPGTPTQAEIFFEMAPVVYERAEEVTLRLLGLIAMENDLVSKYVTEGNIWPRVDEIVDKVIRPAALDEIIELGIVACEVIDGQVLAKAKGAGERAGNVFRLLGWKKEDESIASTTSSPQPEQPSSDSSTDSLTATTGDPTKSDASTGATSEDSKTGSLQTA